MCTRLIAISQCLFEKKEKIYINKQRETKREQFKGNSIYGRYVIRRCSRKKRDVDITFVIFKSDENAIILIKLNARCE